jgi:hypothetical protein
MTKTRLKNSLSPLGHFTEHLVGVFGKLPRENDLDHKSSRLSIRWLNSTPGIQPATNFTHNHPATIHTHELKGKIEIPYVPNTTPQEADAHREQAKKDEQQPVNQNNEEQPTFATGIELSGKINGAAAACFGSRNRKRKLRCH